MISCESILSVIHGSEGENKYCAEILSGTFVVFTVLYYGYSSGISNFIVKFHKTKVPK